MSVNLDELFPDGIPDWRMAEIKRKQKRINEEFDAELFITGETGER